MMKTESQNSSFEVGDAGKQGQRSAWSMPVFWGVLLGAAVALVAAVRRRIDLAEEEAVPQLLEAGEAPSPSVESVPKTSPAAARRDAAKPAPDLAGQGRKSVAPAGKRPTAREPGAPAPAVPQAPASDAASPPSIQSTRWREPTKYVVGIGLFLAMLFLLVISRSVIPTVIIAALLALVVHPIIGALQRRLRLRKGLAIAITYLLIILLLVLIPLVVVPSSISAINDLVNIDFQAWAENASQALSSLSSNVARVPVLNRILQPFLDSLNSALQGISAVPTPEPVSYDVAIEGLVNGLSRTLGIVARVLGPVVSAVISVVFMLLISVHLSLSGDRILQGYPRLLPPAYAPEITALVERIGGVWVSFLRGQFTLMVLIGIMVWLGNAILGNRYPLLLGIISGVLEIIPNLGPALALIPGVGMALIFGSSHFALEPLTFALIVLAFYLLVQVAENNLVVPYVLGGELEIPPLAVILGVMIGGTVAGILGVLLATPFIATGREIFRYLYDKILEPPEVQAPSEEKASFLDAIGNRLRGIRLPFRRRDDQTPAPEAKPS